MTAKRKKDLAGRLLAVDIIRRIVCILCGLVAGFVVPCALGIYHESLEFTVNSPGIRAELRDVAAAAGNHISPSSNTRNGQNDGSMDASVPTPAETHAVQEELRRIRNRFAENARDVTQSVVSLAPRIVVFRSILSPEECQLMINVAKPDMADSELAYADDESDAEKSTEDNTRTSSGTFIDSQTNDERLLALEKRISNLLMTDDKVQESWNVLRYDKGQHYHAHYDYFEPESFHEVADDPGVQRHYTLLLYLSEPEEGGETAFPWEYRNRLDDADFSFENCDSGIKVRPKMGDAVYFESIFPDHSLDELSLHAGCPPSKGMKWVATKWIRVGNYP